MANITVLGTGTWGITLARLLANNGHSVCAWSKIEEEVTVLRETARHPKLPEVILPREIRYETDMGTAISGSEMIVIAVPSPYVRETAAAASPYVTDQIVVDVVKGIERASSKTFSAVIAEELPRARLVVLSGPTHAEEVSLDLPTTIVSASHDQAAAETVQKVFSSKTFRVYTNDDVLGVEIAGAMKNIIALATGVSEGLGCGDNTKAAIITRGIAEIKRLGRKMGCQTSTFSGLAGIGDLVVTCTSRHSRNGKAGRLIGQGYAVSEAIKEVGMVVEGINALPAAIELAEKYQAEMPITFALWDIVEGRLTPEDAIHMLMERELRTE